MRLLHQYVLTAAVSATTSVALYFIPEPIKAAVLAYLPTTSLSQPDTMLEQAASNLSTDNTLIDVISNTVDHAAPVLTTGPNPPAYISDFFARSNGEIWAISALRDGYVFLEPHLHTLAMRIQGLDGNRDVLLLCISLLILLGLSLVVLLLVGLYFSTAMQKKALDKTLRERLLVYEMSENAQTHKQENSEAMMTRRESLATLGRAMNHMARKNLIALDRKNAENAINLKNAMESKACECEAALESAERENAAALERAIDSKVEEHAAALENKDREITAILEGAIYGKTRDRTDTVESITGETSAASSRAMSKDRAHALALEKKDVANSAAMTTAMADKDLEHAAAVQSKDHEHALALETKDREHVLAL